MVVEGAGGKKVPAVCATVLTAAALLSKLSLRFRNAAPRRVGKLSFGGFANGRLKMSSLAWIVLGLIAGICSFSFGDGMGAGSVIDVVIGSALLLVIYGAVSREVVPD